MEDCWASSLGDCGGGISREHLVSECLFKDQSIFVQGLDWCIDAPKQLRIESLTEKILCKDHNSRLSSLDAAACRAFEIIPQFADVTTERNKLPYLPWAPKHFTIDSSKLERWCLKTLLNFSFKRNLIIGPGSHPTGVVPAHLVRIAFGIEEFTDGQGLYIAFKDHETFSFQPRFGYTAKAQDEHLAMGSFRFYGFRFYLNLFPQVTPYTGIEESRVFYRKTRFAQNLGSRFSHDLSIS